MSGSRTAPLLTEFDRRFSRTIAGRPYPERSRRFTGCDSQQLPPNELTKQIEAAIRSRMRFAAGLGSYRDHRALLDDYTQSIQAVREATQDIHKAVEALWQLNTEFQSEGPVNAKARDKVLGELHTKLSEQVHLSLKPPSGMLSASLEAMPVGLAEIELRDALDKAVQGLAMQVCDLLDRMTEHELVGLVDWKTETACDAYFYRYVIIQEQLGKQVIEGKREVVAIHERGFHRVQEVTQEMLHVEKGRHTQRHALYWLYLSDAKATRIEDFRGVVPADIQRFLDCLPEWLRGLVRIVDGTRRSERIIAQDVKVEEYEDTTVVLLHEEERIVYDPLVTLGHYVLTGWGEQETAVETATQWAGGLLVLAALLLFLATGLVALGQLAHRGLGVAGAVVAGLGLAVFLAERAQRSVAEGRGPATVRLILPGLWWTMLCLGLFAVTVGFTSGQSLLLVAGTSLLLASGASYGLTRRSGTKK